MRKIALVLLAFVVVMNASIVLLSWEDSDPEAMRHIPATPDSTIIYEFSIQEAETQSLILVTWNVCTEPRNNTTMEIHLRLDGTVVPWTIQRHFNKQATDDYAWGSTYAAGSYQAIFSPLSGSHEVQLVVVSCSDTVAQGSYYRRAGFQCRIDVIEPSAALCETPDDNNPIPIQSILTSQELIIIPGVVDVFNTSGQRMNVVSGNEVELGRLPVGTFIARTSAGIVKISKLK